MPRRPRVPDRPRVTGGASAYLRRLGLWNDPGSGRFIQRGVSTQKALSLIDLFGYNDGAVSVREAARREGSTLARVVDNRLRRGGIELGDVVEVRFVDDEKGKVRARAGRWYDVQWSRFEPAGVDEPAIETPPLRRLRNSRANQGNLTDREIRRAFAVDGVEVRDLNPQNPTASRRLGFFRGDEQIGTIQYEKNNEGLNVLDWSWDEAAESDGTVTRIWANLADVMERSGVAALTVNIPANRGGYFFARGGWDWRTGGTSQRKAIASEVMRLDESSGLSVEELERVHELGRLAHRDLPSDPTEWPQDLPSPNDLALIGYGPGATTWPGKEILNRHGFSGHLRFSGVPSWRTDPRQRIAGAEDPEDLVERLDSFSLEPSIRRDLVDMAIADLDEDQLNGIYDYLTEARGAPALRERTPEQLRLAIGDVVGAYSNGPGSRANYRRSRPNGVAVTVPGEIATKVRQASPIDRARVMAYELRSLQPDQREPVALLALDLLDADQVDDVLEGIGRSVPWIDDPDPEDSRLRGIAALATVEAATAAPLPESPDVVRKRPTSTATDPLDLDRDGAAALATVSLVGSHALSVTSVEGGPTGIVVTSEVRYADPADLSAGLSAFAQGRKVGTVVQTFDRNGRTVTISEFELDPGSRDLGIASTFYANAVEAYQRAGFEYLAAPPTTGNDSYLVARAGFDWRYGGTDHLHVADVAERMAAEREGTILGRSLTQMAERLRVVPEIPEDPADLPEGFPTPSDVAMLGWSPTRPEWIGKDVLQESEWRGVQWLRPRPERKPPYLPNPRNVSTEVPLPSEITLDEVKAMYDDLDLGDGYRTTATASGSAASRFDVSGSILDPTGNRVGGFNRTVQPRNGSIKHALFTMNADAQAAGIGSRFIARSTENARQAGFREIRVSAANGSYNGAYTWARTGYDWANASDPRRAAEAIEDRLGRLTPDSPERDEAEELARALRQPWLDPAVPPEDFPTPNDVAMLGWSPEKGSGRSGTWIGKEAMMAHGWSGVLRLEPMPRALPPRRPVERFPVVGNEDWGDPLPEESIRRAFDQDLGDGFRSEVTAIEERRVGAFTDQRVRGRILGPTGEHVGSFSRLISLDRPEVEFDSLSIDSDYRGRGLGYRFFSQSLDELQLQGVRSIRTWALSDGANYNGAYSWARAGYDWEGAATASHMAAALSQAAEGYVGEDDELVAEIGALVERLSVAVAPPFPDDFPTPNDVAMLGYSRAAVAAGGPPETWFGKEFLTEPMNWNGRLDLRPLRGRTSSVVERRGPEMFVDRSDVSDTSNRTAVIDGGVRLDELRRQPVVGTYGISSPGQAQVSPSTFLNVGVSARPRTGPVDTISPVYDPSVRSWIDVRTRNTTLSLEHPNPSDSALTGVATSSLGGMDLFYAGPVDPPIRGYLLSPGSPAFSRSADGTRWRVGSGFSDGSTGTMDWNRWPGSVAFITPSQATSDPDITMNEVGAARRAGVNLMVLTPDDEEVDAAAFLARGANTPQPGWRGPREFNPTGNASGAYAATIERDWNDSRQRSQQAHSVVPFADRMEFLAERRDAVAEEDLVVPISSLTLEQITDAGRLLNPHHSRQTVGDININARREAEEYLFGVPTRGITANNRPVTAYPASAVNSPGAPFVAVLDPSVVDRSTMTVGPSMQVANPNAEYRISRTGRRTRIRGAVTRPANHGQAVPLRGPITRTELAGAVARPWSNDIEVQVHGGVRLNQITEVRYNPGVYATAASIEEDLRRYAEHPISSTLRMPSSVRALVSDEIVALLAGAGVSVVVV